MVMTARDNNERIPDYRLPLPAVDQPRRRRNYLNAKAAAAERCCHGFAHRRGIRGATVNSHALTEQLNGSGWELIPRPTATQASAAPRWEGHSAGPTPPSTHPALSRR
jgi:hypothetical protein